MPGPRTFAALCHKPGTGWRSERQEWSKGYQRKRGRKDLQLSSLQSLTAKCTRYLNGREREGEEHALVEGQGAFLAHDTGKAREDVLRLGLREAVACSLPHLLHPHTNDVQGLRAADRKGSCHST